jgi:hypothetical protein
MNLTPTPLRIGEGQKSPWFSTKNQCFTASPLAGERFFPLVELTLIDGKNEIYSPQYY